MRIDRACPSALVMATASRRPGQCDGPATRAVCACPSAHPGRRDEVPSPRPGLRGDQKLHNLLHQGDEDDDKSKKATDNRPRVDRSTDRDIGPGPDEHS